MGKYRAYAKYKDSGIAWAGSIPTEWDVKKFKWLFSIEKRIAGIDWPDVLSITQQGIKLKDIKSGEGQLSQDYSKYQWVFKGDFAMNHMDLLTGYVDVSNYEGVTSPDYRVFRLTNADADKKYLLYLLQMGYTNRLFFPLGRGAAHLGRWRLPTEAFKEFMAPLPSLDEQTQIAAFLDRETVKIDRMISKQKALIELLKEKRQAVISHAVTKGLDPDAPMKDSGVEWLGEIPAHWERRSLRRVVDKFVDYRGRTPQKENDGVRLVTAKNIKEGVIDYQINQEYISEKSYHEWMTRGFPEIGDVLMTTEAPLGAVALVDDVSIALAQRVILYKTSREMLGAFLKYYIMADGGQSELYVRASGSTALGIKADRLKGINVLVPPMPEQEQIVEYIQCIEDEVNAAAYKCVEAISLLQERRTALISAAVTGKIDVREEF